MREDAHGGNGERKILLNDNEVKNIQGMTHGFLPANSKFDWHAHETVNEVMFVLKGQGIIRDEDGVYPYSEGDIFVFPRDIFHEIINESTEEHEYIFIRIYE